MTRKKSWKGFKEVNHSWAKYNREGGIIELIVRDETGLKVESFRVNISDTKTQSRIAGILYDKYGIDFSLFRNIRTSDSEGFFDF